jgi:hypothetical protein
MVRCIFLVELWLLLAIGCNRHQPELPVPASTRQASQGSVEPMSFPGFRVDLTFSDKAREKLSEKKETVIVSAMYSGSPTPKARQSGKYEMGEVGLGDMSVEVMPGQTAKFGNAVLDRDELEQTDKKDPQLLINVYSGRKSSKDNLLTCDLYEGKLAAVQLKSIPIACSLIVENAPSSYINPSQLRP